MTSIEELAQTIAQTHDLDSRVAALDVVRVHVDQIADDADLWNASTNELTDEGAELVAAAIADSYAERLHATVAQQMLDDMADTVAQIAQLDQLRAQQVERRDDLVRAALKTELPRDVIRAASGLSRERLYQIRDGRR